MQVKFEFEMNVPTEDEFLEELETLLNFTIISAYHAVIIDRWDDLYEDKVLVALVHKFAQLDAAVRMSREDGILFYEGMVEERENLAWVLAELF